VSAARSATAAFGTIVVLAALAVPGALPAAAARAAAPSAASTGATGVIVQLFDWPWPAIGAECGNVLGRDGYGAVQISPPEEAVVLAADGYPWWQAYHPVSYRLNSRFGTVAQLASMISACHAAGVKRCTPTWC
jgi:alpha-amylase